MNKTLSRLILVLLLTFVICLSFSACGHEHSYGDWETEIAPKCDTEGLKVRSCDCGEELSKAIPATGHTAGEWITDAEATCTANGSKHQVCSVCNETLTSDAIPAPGHTAGEWITDAEATCTANGSKHQVCSVCSETIKTEVIVAINHTVGEWVTDAEATCTANGSKHQVCSVCNETIKTEAIVAIGSHSYVSKITQTSSCTADGITTYTCSVCNDSYTEKLPHPSYTATEIYDNYLNSVGEIITYDQYGYEYALGTCFVYTADGKIITNYHVIEDSYAAKVTFGSTTYDVQYVLAYDKTIDIAVLQINASGLKPVQLCASNHTVGKVVYAFGNSQGLTSTFSNGMITYSNRVIDGVSYVQHDAPISSGNSGGPLINEYGEVIGINTWTLLDSQNLNFAIHVSELDNLDYSNPMTLAELSELECNVFTAMANYIMEYGDYDSDYNYYYLVFDISYSSDYTIIQYARMAYYYPDDNEITLDCLLDDGNIWFYVTIDEDVSGNYDWIFTYNEYDYEMEGTLYASSFDADTLLDYSYDNIPSSDREYVRELASNMMEDVATYIDTDFADIGVTANDLGFYYF